MLLSARKRLRRSEVRFLADDFERSKRWIGKQIARFAGYHVFSVPRRSDQSRVSRLVEHAARAVGYGLARAKLVGIAPITRPDAETEGSQPAAGLPTRMDAFADGFAGVTPWRGHVPQGFLVDFLGTLTDASFRTDFGVDAATVGGSHQETTLPVLSRDGEGWFEAYNWVAAAREARGEFRMVTLGACYGAQAVGAYRALMQINPMPCKLVAVEPDPGNLAWLRKHFTDNGLDPDDHWIVEAALSDRRDPVLFPVGAVGLGQADCTWTNHPSERKYWAQMIIRHQLSDEVVDKLLVGNRTGIKVPLVPEGPPLAELRYVSAVTLDDVLAPFDHVDYVEADLQHSETIVFPPAMRQLTRKVRRVHIGTHSAQGHRQLRKMFEEMGWEILFSFEPLQTHQSSLGAFTVNDGILTALNPNQRR
jgi:FkbM family methyltransferase